jgi:hypothetical protein
MLRACALLLLVFLQVVRGIQIDVDNIGTFPAATLPLRGKIMLIWLRVRINQEGCEHCCIRSGELLQRQ